MGQIEATTKNIGIEEASSLQYVTDAAGNRLAVIVPIDEWSYIKDTYLARRELMESLKAGFEEIKLAKAGKVKLMSIEDLLDEL